MKTETAILHIEEDVKLTTVRHRLVVHDGPILTIPFDKPWRLEGFEVTWRRIDARTNPGLWSWNADVIGPRIRMDGGDVSNRKEVRSLLPMDADPWPTEAPGLWETLTTVARGCLPTW